MNVKTLISSVTCSVCKAEYDLIVGRSQTESEQLMFDMSSGRNSRQNARLANEMCGKRFEYEDSCTGTFQWRLLPKYQLCTKCGRVYEGIVGGKCSEFLSKDPRTGAVYRCGGNLMERARAGVLQCRSCMWFWTILQHVDDFGARSIRLACSDDVDSSPESSLSRPVFPRSPGYRLLERNLSKITL